MTDYRKLVTRKPPIGLLSFVADELDTAGLVYELEWVQDYSLDTVLTDNVKKQKAVRCTCSECGLSAIVDYAVPDPSRAGSRGRYGFYHPDDPMRDPTRDGDSTLCPVCESPVSVRCAAAVGSGHFTASETNVMSASLLPGAPGERPLVLAGWQIRRLVNRYGTDRYDVRPLEAYVFEAHDAYKLNGWVNSYSGTGGYFISVCREWRQPKDWSETWGRVSGIFGLTPELVAESCLPNCKLGRYIEDGAWRGLKSPVAYLRLYQRHPQVENLVVQGCGYLLGALLGEAQERTNWEHNCKGAADLSELNLRENRPAQMLGLTMDEFRVMQAQCWDLYHWRIFVKAKAAGDHMKLPEDITLLHQYGGEDIEVVIGRAPVGKTLRYLLKTMEEWGAANDIYNEYVDYQPGEDLLDATYLTDYWDMAAQAEWDLSDSAIRWPKNLFAAHDRSMAACKVMASKKLAPMFKDRARALETFTYISGPLMIRPAHSQRELNREGSLLDHCVAGYGENMALGKKAIFFIRHTWEPKKPYFTLDYDEQSESVNQNRGRRNCARTPEVEAFEAEWLAWIHGGCKRNRDGTPVGAKPPQRERRMPPHEKAVDAA